MGDLLKEAKFENKHSHFIVESLENLLEKAKKGEFIGLVYVATVKGSTFDWGVTGDTSILETIGALNFLASKLSET